MEQLSDSLLLEAYCYAKELQLDEDFIELLETETEINKRQLTSLLK